MNARAFSLYWMLGVEPRLCETPVVPWGQCWLLILSLWLLNLSPASAARPHPTPPPKSAPAPSTAPAPTVVTSMPTEPAVPMARQRTIQEDLELRDWIVGIQTTAQDAVKRADAAETEAKASRDQSAIAVLKLTTAGQQLEEVQKQYATVQTERDQAITALAVEHKARIAAEAHVSRIKTWLGFALGGLLVLLVQYLPWGLLTPPASLYGRVGASIAAFGLGWLLVARFI